MASRRRSLSGPPDFDSSTLSANYDRIRRKKKTCYGRQNKDSPIDLQQKVHQKHKLLDLINEHQNVSKKSPCLKIKKLRLNFMDELELRIHRWLDDQGVKMVNPAEKMHDYYQQRKKEVHQLIGQVSCEDLIESNERLVETCERLDDGEQKEQDDSSHDSEGGRQEGLEGFQLHLDLNRFKKRRSITNPKQQKLFEINTNMTVIAKQQQPQQPILQLKQCVQLEKEAETSQQGDEKDNQDQSPKPQEEDQNNLHKRVNLELPTLQISGKKKKKKSPSHYGCLVQQNFIQNEPNKIIESELEDALSTELAKNKNHQLLLNPILAFSNHVTEIQSND